MIVFCVDEFTAAIVPIKNSTNQFLAGIGPYLTVFTWDEISAESTYVVLARPETEAAFPGNFFNDGKADITGRFWIGEPIVKYFCGSGWTCIIFSL